MYAPEIQPRGRGMNAGKVLRVFSHRVSDNVRLNGDTLKSSFFIPLSEKSRILT